MNKNDENGSVGNVNDENANVVNAKGKKNSFAVESARLRSGNDERLKPKLPQAPRTIGIVGKDDLEVNQKKVHLSVKVQQKVGPLAVTKRNVGL